MMTRFGRLCVLALALSGCGEDGTGIARSLQVTTVGRAERGLELTLIAIERNDTLPPAQVQWTAQPAASVEMLPGGRVRLLQAGSITFTAQSADVSGSTTVSVAVPPMLVLDITRDGNKDIYVVALDGGDLRRLTTHASVDENPTVAGNTVVFTTYRHGNADLYSYTLPNGPETRLTSAVTDEQNPALSPNGQRLAFTRAPAGGIPRLYVAPFSDPAATQLAATNVTGGFILEGSPVWATSETLVFTSVVRGSNDLFSISNPPGNPSDLLVRPGADVDPSVSPDGRTVLFAGAEAGSGSDDLQLHAVDLQSRAVRVLLRRPGTDSRAVALGDGRIVFVALDPDPDRIYWFDPADPTGTLHPVPLGEGFIPGELAVVRN